MLERFRKFPIGKKLQAINLLIVGLITLLTSLNLSFYMFSSLLDDYERKSSTLSRVLAESLDSALLFNDVNAAKDVLMSLRLVPDVAHAAIYDKSGRLFASYASANTPFSPPLNFDPSQYGNSARFGVQSQNFALPILSSARNQEQIGTITLNMDLSEAYRGLYKQIGIVLLIGLFILAVVSTLLTKLQESITLPLLALTNVMRKVSKEGDLSVRANPSSEDEIGELASVFNHMID